MFQRIADVARVVGDEGDQDEHRAEEEEEPAELLDLHIRAAGFFGGDESGCSDVDATWDLRNGTVTTALSFGVSSWF